MMPRAVNTNQEVPAAVPPTAPPATNQAPPATNQAPPAAATKRRFVVVQPLLGIDGPGILRAPGYAFEGDPEACAPLVKLGYLKNA
jgi:hypothetical protein